MIIAAAVVTVVRDNLAILFLRAVRNLTIILFTALYLSFLLVVQIIGYFGTCLSRNLLNSRTREFRSSWSLFVRLIQAAVAGLRHLHTDRVDEVCLGYSWVFEA